MKNSLMHRVMWTLLVAAILLPIIALVASGLAVLLEAMGDDWGAGMVRRTAVVLGAVWTLDLILLILAQGVAWLRTEPDVKRDE